MSNFVSKNVSEFPTPPSGGLIPPTFAQHPLPLPRLHGERRERGEGERRRERTPKGWLTPHVPHPEKYPECGKTMKETFIERKLRTLHI